MLALEAVSDLLGTKRSGVFEVMIGGGAEAGGDKGWADPNEDKDEAEAMASALIAVQSSAECLRVTEEVFVCSRELDFRSCWVKLSALGLRDIPADLESFIEALDGEVTSFFPSGFEKLHFFEGVLWLLVGVVDFRDKCLDGVLKDGTSSGAGRSISLPPRFAVGLSSKVSTVATGNTIPALACCTGFKEEKSFGRGGTGGTILSSTFSLAAAKAARSRREMASDEWLLEMSLLALFLLVFEFD